MILQERYLLPHPILDTVWIQDFLKSQPRSLKSSDISLPTSHDNERKEQGKIDDHCPNIRKSSDIYICYKSKNYLKTPTFCRLILMFITNLYYTIKAKILKNLVRQSAGLHLSQLMRLFI